MAKDSWDEAGAWYDKIVSDQGHDYHKEVILPALLQEMNPQKGERVLDLACGQGILERHLPKGVDYVGLDCAPSLIQAAKKRGSSGKFFVKDVSQPLGFDEAFDHAAMILALQNMKEGEKAVCEGAKALNPKGLFYFVINHPCYRIPRQSFWTIDEQKKLMSRKIDRYLSFLDIPIRMNPGNREKSVETMTYHRPLEEIFRWFANGALSVTHLRELVSHKESHGKNKKMENRAREEFPLFMLIVCKKS